MRRTILVIGMIAGMLLLNISPAFACGDKSLRIGRGARFRRNAHPASILIYIPSDAPVAAIKTVPRLRAYLKEAGHKPSVVQGADNLREVLASGQYDVVLSSIAEVANLQRQIESSSSKPVIVPVVVKGTNAAGLNQKQFRYIVKDPNSGDQYLDAIEGAMDSRMRLLAKKA